MNQDEEQLRILSIFHAIVAALAGLFSLLPMIHLLLGFGMLTGHLGARRPPDPFTAMMGWLFVTFASFAIACGLAYAVCLALAARFLARHEKHTYCLVTACVSCLFMPFGTLLGIFTLLILLRPSVKQLFGVDLRAPADAARPPS